MVPDPYVPRLLFELPNVPDDCDLELVERKEGDIFRTSGLIAAADAQSRPVFTSTEVHIVKSYESPNHC